MGPFQILLFVVWAVSAVALTILVLMHSGKGTGVSDMIASSLYNSSSATGVMEQNLDRLTVLWPLFLPCASSCACSSSRRASWATKHRRIYVCNGSRMCGTLFVYIFVTESKYPHILRPTKEILDR